MAVAAGSGHALALRRDGTLWAFGGNEHGQIGDGNIVRGSRRPPASVTPLTQVGTNRNWIAIAAACYSSLGLQSDGSLWQWGQVQVAGIGAASELNLSLPTRVGEETNWTAISAGDFCFLGRQRDGSLWAWGANAPPLGRASQTDPCLVSGNTNWSAAAVGSGLLAALQDNGTLWQCGLTYDGAGGANRVRELVVPSAVGQRQDWVSVWVKWWAGFGLTQDGTLWTWGHRPDKLREGSEALEDVSRWLRRHRMPGPMYLRKPAGSETPWPLVRFVTNGPAATR